MPFTLPITVNDAALVLILFIAGYIIGSSIKGSIKLVLMLIVFIVALISLGLISEEILKNFMVAIGILKESAIGNSSALGIELNIFDIKILSFLGGLVIGFIKG